MIEVLTVALMGLLAGLIGHYIGNFLKQTPTPDEVNRIEIDYNNGQSARVEITGELTGEQVDQLLKMIQEKLVSPPPEQTTMP